MDHLWSPWRYQYIQGAKSTDACIFCARLAADNDEENLIVHRAASNFVILNLYPYTTGHLMIVPYQHVATLGAASQDALQEMILLARDAEKHLGSIYRPAGFNIGMNIGECAGAGVARHIHMHVLPRWKGDANFLSTIGETRVMPEDLQVTWKKLREAFASG
ncbi:MAG: HIT domain-containing protein [Acidobacteriota bacterium]|nr:HIT domain-containing protein [Acidobacteriota bacterium]